MKREDLYSIRLEKYFEKMGKSFLEEDAEGVEGNIKFRIFDPDNQSDYEDWFVTFRESKCTITSGGGDRNDVLILVDRKTFINGFLGIEDQMDIFKNQKMTMDGDQHLAMYSKILFESPQWFDEWFFMLEHSLLEPGDPDLEVAYRFVIRKDRIEDEEDVFLNFNQDVCNRYVIINKGECEFLPFYEKKYDVEFEIQESDLSDLISGRQSYFDLFLASKLKVKGDLEQIYNFPSYFKASRFSNRSINLLNPEMILKNMHQMCGRIPDRMNDKALFFEFTGEHKGKYFIRIDQNRINFVSKENIGDIDTKVKMDSQTFIDISCGVSDYYDIFADGGIQFKGNEKLGMDFDALFQYRLPVGMD